MQFRRLPLCVAVLACLAAFLPARATTVIQPSFDQLVGSADYIVRAQVKAVESEWRVNAAKPGERYIGTRITLDVREVIKGTPPQPLVISVVGGRIGDEELVVNGAPKFEAGDECILFVRGNGHSFFPLVGLMHGYFPVYRDIPTGRASVLRYNGQPLYSERQLDSSGTPAANFRSATSRPMTPEAFRDRIQQQQREIISREKQR